RSNWHPNHKNHRDTENARKSSMPSLHNVFTSSVKPKPARDSAANKINCTARRCRKRAVISYASSNKLQRRVLFETNIHRVASISPRVHNPPQIDVRKERMIVYQELPLDFRRRNVGIVRTVGVGELREVFQHSAILSW